MLQTARSIAPIRLLISQMIATMGIATSTPAMKRFLSQRAGLNRGFFGLARVSG